MGSSSAPDLVLIGVSHRSAAVDVRERIAFSSEVLPEAVNRLRGIPGLHGGVILSTCNRVEIYADGTCPERPVDQVLRRFTEDFHAQPMTGFEDACYVRYRRGVVEHLFRVASGLDSMVPGEGEILRQVRDAYGLAHRTGATSRGLNRLFQRAIHIGKRVRTETHIARGPISVGAVAVDLAKRIFSDLKTKRVLLLGAGEVGELTAKYLADGGVQDLLVANRSGEKAERLAKQFGGRPVAFSSITHAMEEIDIAVVSTAAPSWIVMRNQVDRIMRVRHGRPLFLIDLSVPRNVDPSVNQLENVYLYDIDDLQVIVNENLSLRRRELDRAQQLVDQCVEECCGQFGYGNGWGGERPAVDAPVDVLADSLDRSTCQPRSPQMRQRAQASGTVPGVPTEHAA